MRFSAVPLAPLVCLPLAVVAVACGERRPVDRTWHQEAGYRWRLLQDPGNDGPGFTSLDSARSGIAFVNTASDSLLRRNRILAQGGGVCLGDVDGDTLADVFLARTEGPNALYRNLGDWRFVDVAAAAGVAAADRYATGCALIDVEGDRDLDLILLALGGPNALFLNDGAGRFREETIEAGLESTAGSTTLTAADVEGDGDLDLYVANYKAYTTLDRMSPQERAFDHVVRQLGPRQFEVRERFRSEYKLVEREDLGAISLVQRADPDFFYRNEGGRFVREPIAGNRRFLDERGRPLAKEPEDFGLAATLVDLTGDGAPDLYVANDFEDPDRLWLNDGRGTFHLAPWFAMRSTSNSTMAVDVSDVNADGLPDFFQVDMLSLDTRRLKTQVPTHSPVSKAPGLAPARHQMQRNTLHLNRGDGTFAEVARYAGVGASGWSWSTLFLDVNLDGWEDLLIGTGHRWDLMDGDAQNRLRQRLREIDWRRMMFEYPPLPLPNVAFRNRGDLTFEDAGSDWHFDLGEDLSHGMAVADLDQDGDLDVVINRLGAPAAVLRNDAPAPRLAVRLRGTPPNTGGIGSLIRVRAAGLPLQERQVTAGGLYLSSSDALQSFATGAAAQVTIEVDWRDGRRSVIEGARPGRLYEIDQGLSVISHQSSVLTTDNRQLRTLFDDITAQLGGHAHVEPYFDDFVRQPLLPGALSQLGPGVAWHDVDRDGREDLVVGAGRTGTLAWFHNDGRRLRPVPPLAAPSHLDLTTVLGWPEAGDARIVLAGVSSYEMPSIEFALRVPSVVAYSLATGAMTELIPGDSGSAGPIAAADYDGDGDLDLFVGARVLPAGYPFSGTSRLFRNEGRGRFVLDAENTPQLERLGMVSAAVFSDLTGDGWPDLLAATEWGPIHVFRNDQGRFRNAALRGLTDRPSRWNGIATGDLDGDGRLDVVATSWGRNRDHRATTERPLFLYYAFFGGSSPYVLLAQEDRRLDAI
ncbi:MAG: VCBS repeat-containing protein, partial [Gemmatimonadales bacterium]